MGARAPPGAPGAAAPRACGAPGRARTGVGTGGRAARSPAEQRRGTGWAERAPCAALALGGPSPSGDVLRSLRVPTSAGRLRHRAL